MLLHCDHVCYTCRVVKNHIFLSITQKLQMGSSLDLKYVCKRTRSLYLSILFVLNVYNMINKSRFVQKIRVRKMVGTLLEKLEVGIV